MVAGPRERDTRKLHSKVAKGRAAKELVENPILTEALDAIEKEIEMGWKNSSAEDQAGRDNAYLMFRLLKRLRGHLRQIIVDGGNAAKLLSLEEEKTGGGRGRASSKPERATADKT